MGGLVFGWGIVRNNMAYKHKRAAVAAGRWYRKGVREGGTGRGYKNAVHKEGYSIS